MEINSLDTSAAVRGWPVFHDGQVRRFLVIWLEQQTARLGLQLETIAEEDLKQVQGQITAFRIMRTLLEANSIAAIIEDMNNKR